MSDEMKNKAEDVMTTEEVKSEEIKSEKVKSEEIKVEKKGEKKYKIQYKKKKEKIDIVKWIKTIVTVGLLVLAVVVFSEGCGAVEEMDILPDSMEFSRPVIDAGDGTDAGSGNVGSDVGDETDGSGVTQE